MKNAAGIACYIYEGGSALARRNRKQMMENVSRRKSATNYHDSLPGWLRNLEGDLPCLLRSKKMPDIELWQMQQRKKRKEAAARQREIEKQRMEERRKKRAEARKRRNKRKGNKRNGK